MKRILSSLTLSICLALGGFVGIAAEKAPEKKAEKSEKSAPRARPIAGKIEAFHAALVGLTVESLRRGRRRAAVKNVGPIVGAFELFDALLSHVSKSNTYGQCSE